MRSATTTASLLRLLLSEADRDIRVRLLAASLLVAAGGLLAALAPLALKSLVDTLAGAGPSKPSSASSGIAIFAGAYIAALLAGRLLNELRPLLVGSADQRLQARLSRRFFAHVLRLPAAFHLDRPGSALSHTISQGSAACQQVMNHLLQALPIAVELVTAIVVLGHLGQPALVAIFVASALAYAWVFSSGTGPVRRRGKEVSKCATAAYATMGDALLNIETIKCFDASAEANARFAAASTALERSWSGLHRQRARLGLMVAAIFGSSVAASLFVAVSAVERGALSIGGFVLCTVYMLQMVRPVEAIGAAVRDISQAIEFAAPALDLLRKPSEETGLTFTGPALRHAQTQAAASSPADIHLKNLRLAYPGGPGVLSDLCLHIPAGTSLAIVGPSGAGKSSLARLLLRLVEPDAGQILFNGVSSDQLDPAGIRRMIGYVSQDVALFDDTIAANVGIGRPHATCTEIEEACRAARVHDFISMLPAGYQTRVGERGLKLSGGERQRIAIARAILKRPSIYLFDEATSALDSSTEADILRELPEIFRGCTTLIITHRLAAARCAQRIAVLQGGRIAELGTHRELLRQAGLYVQMWHMQSDATADSTLSSGQIHSA